MRELAQYYKTLELEPGASLEDIHQGYKDLATVWHPDRFLSNPRLHHKAHEKLKELNEAHEQLKALWMKQPVPSQRTPVGAASAAYSTPRTAYRQNPYPSQPADYDRVLHHYVRGMERKQRDVTWLD